MKRSTFKFAAPQPGTSQTHADLAQVYRDAGYSQADAERLAARAVGEGRLRHAVGKSVNPSAPRLLTDADGID